MDIPAARARPPSFPLPGSLFLVGLLVAAYHGVPERLLHSRPPWAQVLGASLWDLPKLTLVLVPTLLIAVRSRVRVHLAGFWRGASVPPSTRFLLLEAGAYLGFACLSTILLTGPGHPGRWLVAAVLGWFVLAVAGVGLAFSSFAPGEFWIDVVKEERPAVLFALVSCIAWLSAPAAQLLWEPLGNLTFQLSGGLLGHFYDGVLIDSLSRTLGTSEFRVRIGPACSGYEGIGLITAFLGGYFWLFRAEIRFPRALVLFPVCAGAAWLLNVLRITLLVAIGLSFSPDVALEGFHSQAGWIAFVLIALGITVVVHRLPFFSARQASVRPRDTARSSEPLLVPFLALLAAALTTSALSAGFDWAYPLRVAATGAALWRFRKHYRVKGYRLAVEPVLIGAMVFLLWIALVPASPRVTGAFSTELASASQGAVVSWLAFRVLGTVFTVPIAEELAFRGYLLSRLSGVGPDDDGLAHFAWLPFLISAVLFGAVHSSWVAGSLAGACYALARYRRGALGDAVVAHMTTNALLSLYVLATKQWSLW